MVATPWGMQTPTQIWMRIETLDGEIKHLDDKIAAEKAQRLLSRPLPTRSTEARFLTFLREPIPAAAVRESKFITFNIVFPHDLDGLRVKQYYSLASAPAQQQKTF